MDLTGLGSIFDFGTKLIDKLLPDPALKAQATLELARLQQSGELAQISSDTAILQAVNATIQADARGDSWLQKNHHAIESLTATFLVVGVYFVLPLLKVPVPIIPEFAFMMIGAILGVTAWQHGQVNKEIAKNS